MFGDMRWPFDIFNFQREADRIFSQFWNELPSRSARRTLSFPFQVHTSSDSWRLDVPMPGIDPEDVAIEVAGNTITVRAEHTGVTADGESRYEQTMTVPQFLDLDRVAASHRHGMLELTIPLKDSVKPRRIEIDSIAEPERQLAAAK
jgi:HSP20 family protein